MKPMNWIAMAAAFGAVAVCPAHASDSRGLTVAETAAVETADEQVYKSKGVVNSVDTKAGKVSLNMDPVPSLNWPAMTMDFAVADKKILGSLKPGRKIEFDFIEKPKNRYVITKTTPADR